MIECTSEYVWYKKRRKLKPKKVFAFFCVILMIFSLILYIKYFVCEQIYKLCANYSYSYCTESVNLAVIETLNDKIKYADLVLIDKNVNGDIVLISANSHKVNTISREIASSTELHLKNKLSVGVPVPILAFSGIGLISGLGKSVNVKTLSVSNVVCGFNSSFTSVGINQTLHSVYVEIMCEVRFSFPFNSVTQEHKSTVLIAETVLVGKVPEIYLNGKIFG